MSEKHNSGHRRQSDHRRHRHSLGYRVLRKLRRHKWIVPTAVILVAALVAAGLWARSSLSSQRRYRVSAGTPTNANASYRNISYKGKEYRYNSRITAILYAGLDSTGPLEAQSTYTSAPRADSISLVVLDEYHRKMTIIALSRDTMTPIRKYTLHGKDRGLLEDHLGYAYTYGDGADVSARNLCEAVSTLLYGVPVHDYIVTNFDSLPILSDAIGPVTVKVPNDDLIEFGYAKGDDVTVTGENLEWFVRTRDTGKDYSNVGRMQRQQTYINAVAGRIRSDLQRDPSGTWKVMEQAETCLRTSITRNRYLDLIKVMENTVYDDSDYYIPEGRQVVGRDHDEFYPDEEALLQKVIDIFYIEK